MTNTYLKLTKPFLLGFRPHISKVNILHWDTKESSLQLECRVYAQPKATVQWIYHNKVISNNTDHTLTYNKIQISNLNTLYNLTIGIKKIKSDAFKCDVNGSRANCHLQYLCEAFYANKETSTKKPPSVEFNGKFS